VRRHAFARIQYRDGKLSISGVVGPRGNGDAYGSVGQWIMDFKDYDERGRLTLADIQPAPGWTADTVRRFFDVWERWHLNDMRAGCAHQRAEGWGERRIDESKPATAYGKFHPGQHGPTWNLLGWVTPAEVPGGLMTAPCPTCGYKYGTAWLTEEVPADVLAFLAALPDTDLAPAWV
jgi:hypothetical protein